jgi:hypothetical protein
VHTTRYHMAGQLLTPGLNEMEVMPLRDLLIESDQSAVFGLNDSKDLLIDSAKPKVGLSDSAREVLMCFCVSIIFVIPSNQFVTPHFCVA